MATKKSHAQSRSAAALAAPIAPKPLRWPYAAAVAVMLVVVFWIYGPALHGPLLFDDLYSLPKGSEPASALLHGVRPLLMLTFWLNARSSAGNTYSYHLVNVWLHFVSGALIFFVMKRLLEWSGTDRVRGNWLAAFAAAVFWVHPLQTEAVAYITGRSEALSVMLFLAAYAVFLWRRSPAISWTTAAAVLVLFGASLLSKEHTIVLPALLLLTDFWWSAGRGTDKAAVPGRGDGHLGTFAGIRGNWRLYVPMALGALGGIAFLLPLLLNGNNAGFGLKDLTWYQYFFTQCRALFLYPLLFVLPVRQSADWNFPISKTVFDHGAIAGLLALLGLIAAAWRFRRNYPLASFGFFAYLLLMAPTSSILPIKDAFAERRLYLSMLGLLLIAVAFLRHIKWEPRKLAAACCAAAIAYGGVAHARAQVWSSELALWQDTVEKSPDSYRAHFQLASAYQNANMCDRAVAEYQKTAELRMPGYDLLLDWGLAYDCLHEPEQALAKLTQAAAIKPSAHVYTQLAKVYWDSGRSAEAKRALDTAERIDPGFAITYWYRGKIHLANKEIEAAIQDLQHTVSLDPNLGDARQALAQAQRLLLARH